MQAGFDLHLPQWNLVHALLVSSFMRNWKDTEVNLASACPVHLSAAEDFQQYNCFHSHRR